MKSPVFQSRSIHTSNLETGIIVALREELSSQYQDWSAQRQYIVVGLEVSFGKVYLSVDKVLHRVATKEREEVERTTKQKMAR